jgi:hypothetical protein
MKKIAISLAFLLVLWSCRHVRLHRVPQHHDRSTGADTPERVEDLVGFGGPSTGPWYTESENSLDGFDVIASSIRMTTCLAIPALLGYFLWGIFYDKKKENAARYGDCFALSLGLLVAFWSGQRMDWEYHPRHYDEQFDQWTDAAYFNKSSLDLYMLDSVAEFVRGCVAIASLVGLGMGINEQLKRRRKINRLVQFVDNHEGWLDEFEHKGSVDQHSAERSSSESGADSHILRQPAPFV